jgi:hypothetical protein
MKPRHVFACLLLLGEAVILAPLVAGALITGTIYAASVATERLRLSLPMLRERMQGFLARRRSHGPRHGGPALGW